MSDNIYCPLCHNKSSNIKYPSTFSRHTDKQKGYVITENTIGVHGDMHECQKCSLIFVPENELGIDSISYYEEQTIDKAYIQELKNRERGAIRMLKKIESLYPKKGKLLEVGCSTGSFLYQAKKLNWEASGVELAKWAIDIARKQYEVEIFENSLFTKLEESEDNLYNVIVALDVIEHLSNPRLFVSLAKKKLTPGGMLVLVTPNIDSSFAKLTKENWYAIIPSHIIYFSKATLKNLLTEEGFSITFLRTYTRYFSLNYIGYRLKGFTFTLFRIIGYLLEVTPLKHIVIPINLGADIEVYARK